MPHPAHPLWPGYRTYVEGSFFDDDYSDRFGPLPPSCQPDPSSLPRRSPFSILHKAKNRASSFLHDTLLGRSRSKAVASSTHRPRPLTESCLPRASYLTNALQSGSTRYPAIGYDDGPWMRPVRSLTMNSRFGASQVSLGTRQQPVAPHAAFMQRPRPRTSRPNLGIDPVRHYFSFITIYIS